MMIKTDTIKKDFYQEQNQNNQNQVRVTNSPFRYNTPYSNLAYEDANKFSQAQD